MRAPLVSIITPSFNQARFLEATIRSVLEQDYPRIEYIIIDGASTDGSVDILRRYANELNYWVSEPDGGQTDAINKGFRIARGELVGWLNSDDELCPGSVAAIVARFEQRPELGLVYGDIERIDSTGRHLGLQHYRDFDIVSLVRSAGYISQPGSLMRRAVVEEIGGLDPTLHFMMDLDLWLRAGLRAPFGYHRSVVARFRVHDEAKSSGRLDVAADDILRVYRKLFSRADLPATLRAVQAEAWGSAYLAAARALYGADHNRAAFVHLIRALERHPASVFDSRVSWMLPRLFASVLGGRHSTLGKRLRRLYRTVKSVSAS